jgi:hypothetical protein
MILLFYYKPSFVLFNTRTACLKLTNNKIKKQQGAQCLRHT